MSFNSYTILAEIKGTQDRITIRHAQEDLRRNSAIGDGSDVYIIRTVFSAKSLERNYELTEHAVTVL